MRDAIRRKRIKIRAVAIGSENRTVVIDFGA